MYMFIYSKCFAGSSHKKCVYPTIRIYLLKKCIHYYTYKNALHCQFSRCRQQCAHTCICILFQKVHTLPYIPICRQQSGKEDKTQFCGQVNDCNPIAQCKGAAPALLLLFHCPRCAYNLPAIHPAAAPRPRLPATLTRCRAHKNKKKM